MDTQHRVNSPVPAAVAGLLLAASFALADGALDVERLRADLSALASGPHRLAGTEDGSRAASRYVATRLGTIGFAEIYRQEFPVVQPVATECRLVVDGVDYPLFVVRPNVVQASVTPPEGISGQTLYAGRGRPEDYGEELAEGKVVVLDFDSDMNWRHAFAFGARAVVFVGDGTPAHNTWHHANIPANFPRFYVTADTADGLGLRSRVRQVTLVAACEWVTLRGRNVIAVLRGTAAQADRDEPAETVVLAAPLDSYSEVPLLAPGARDAANCAGLLHCAAALARNPPRCDVVFCFFDGQALRHAGARAFYGALCRRLKGAKLARFTLDERLQMLSEQREQMAQIGEVLSCDDVFSPAAREIEAHRGAIRALTSEARTMSGRALEGLRALRLERHVLAEARTEAREREDGPQEQELTGTIDALTVAIAALQEEDLSWNRIQRDLSKEEILPESRDRFQKLAGLTQEWCRRRTAEIDESIETGRSDIILRDAIGPTRNTIGLHLSFDLGDARDRWTIIHGDDSMPTGRDDPGIYSGLFKVIRACHERVAPDMGHFEPRAVSALYGSRSFAPAMRVDSGGVARMFGIFNLALSTVMDRHPRQGQPADTLAALNGSHVETQLREAIPFLEALLDDPGLIQSSPLRPRVHFTEIVWSGGKASGPTVRQVGAASAMRPPPVRGAVVALLQGLKGHQGVAVPSRPDDIPPGYDHVARVMSNADGMFESAPDTMGMRQILAVTFDRPGDRTPGAAGSEESGAAGRGLISGITCEKSANWPGDLSRALIHVCRTRSLSVVGYGYDRELVKTRAMRGSASGPFPADKHLLCEQGNMVALFAPYDASQAKLFNLKGLVILNNRATKEAYQGEGIPLADPFAHPVTPGRSAHDLRTLNSYRLTMLRDNRIRQDSLEVLNGFAADTEADAVADDALPVVQRLGSLGAATSYSRRVYRPLVGVLKDLVTAVVWLLLLAIPFAYALERLLIGTPHIYRQIGWFAFFFALSFAVLYLVNPAFRLAATPIIIFLAFAIVLLSSMVIHIMIRKLQSEVKRMQGLSASAHSADISRLTTMTAAVHMGISTMRRRPVRTSLTTLTVILLTFTILTFSSFGNYWGTRETYAGPMPGLPHRVVVRSPLWHPIVEDVYQTVKGFVSREADVVPRYWVAPTMWGGTHMRGAGQGAMMLLVEDPDIDPVPISAAIGVATNDILRQERLGELFAAGARLDVLADDGIVLTRAVSAALGLVPEDVGRATLLFGGEELTYAGVVADELAAHRQLDGSSVLPVDYAMSTGGALEAFRDRQTDAAAEGEDDANDVSMQFICYSLDETVIVSPQAAARLGGQIRSLCIYPHDETRDKDIASGVATVTGLATYAGTGGGVGRFFFMSLVETRGWRDLLIPVVLGSLIIFATMLGSITDRAEEIHTFSAVGLAPAHVAGLFFAEAAVYAVVGGMGGYLLGQAVVRIMGWLASHFLLPVPTLNYSSMNVIVTLLVIMATILISTVYPAVKASRSANPGVQRAWRIPEPAGDVLDVLFPFTVSAYDFMGVVTFLKEHFDTHMDTFLGVFAASGTRIFRQGDSGGLAICSTVALAPFDLGVEQAFVLFSQPSDIEGVDEVRILFRRTAGSPRDWRRANRVFIDDLRKQFLLWRLLSTDVTEHYRNVTAEVWNSLPVEDPVAEGTTPAYAGTESDGVAV